MYAFDTPLGGDHDSVSIKGPDGAEDVPKFSDPAPDVAPRSAGHAKVVHPLPSNDQPPTITPGLAVAASTAAHVSLATV